MAPPWWNILENGKDMNAAAIALFCSDCIEFRAWIDRFPKALSFKKQLESSERRTGPMIIWSMESMGMVSTGYFQASSE